MPAALERKLRREANADSSIKDKDAYVYGTLRKTGWKPSTQKKKEKKMSNTSKLVRLAQIDGRLDSIVRFAYDDEDDKTFPTGKLAAGAAAGTAGLYGYGLVRRGVNPTAGSLYKAAGTDVRNIGSAMGAGRFPTAALSDIGSSIAAGGRGVAAGAKAGLGKLAGLWGKMRGLSSREKLVRFDEKILEPASAEAVPHTKIIQEQFPAGLSPAAALQMPFPELMKLLKQRNILQEQFPGFSRLGRLIELNAKLDEITFQDQEYKPRIVQRALLGPEITVGIHGQSGQRIRGAGEAYWNRFKNTVGGLGVGAGAGAGVGAGIGALAALKRGRVRPAAGMGALWGGIAGADIGGFAGTLKGTFGKKAEEIYRRRTGQEG